MAEHGGIVTHLTALEEIASMKVLCSDKTGTLTLGKMNIKYDDMKSYNGYSPEQALELAACASNASNLDDPIDNAVFKALNTKFGILDDPGAKKGKAAKELEKKYKKEKYVGFNPQVKRTVAYMVDGSGNKLQIGKGIVNRILETSHDDGGIQWEVENFEAMQKQVADDDAVFARGGYKTIGVAVAKWWTDEVHRFASYPGSASR